MIDRLIRAIWKCAVCSVRDSALSCSNIDHFRFGVPLMARHCMFAEIFYASQWNASNRTIYNFQVSFWVSFFLCSAIFVHIVCANHSCIDSIQCGIVSGPFIALSAFVVLPLFRPPFIDRLPFASSNCKMQRLRSFFFFFHERSVHQPWSMAYSIHNRQK